MARHPMGSHQCEPTSFCQFADNEILGPVVDNVLYDKSVSKDVALKRAKAILTIGGIFKAVEADEDDEERRELERLVQNAAGKKKKHHKARKGSPGAEPATVDAIPEKA